jgi:hypothetical protein
MDTNTHSGAGARRQGKTSKPKAKGRTGNPIDSPVDAPADLAQDMVDLSPQPLRRQDRCARLNKMGISAVSVDRARPEVLRAHLKREIDTLGGLLVKAGVQPD